MKRGKLRRKSKSPQKVLEDLLWQECRRIALEQYGIKQPDGSYKVDCYTCSAKDLQGVNRQLGHVPYPKSVLGAYLKYDVFRTLRWQCYSCNINKGGMGAEAYRKMLKEEGKNFMDELEKDRNVSVKSTDHYTKLLKEYQKIIK